MKNIEEEYKNPKFTMREKAFLYDLQFRLWQFADKKGMRQKYGITSIVVYAFPVYTGEFDKETYDLLGLGAAQTVIELVVTFKNGASSNPLGQADRYDEVDIAYTAQELLVIGCEKRPTT